MKKKLSIILCLVLALSLLSGCGAGNPVNNADPGNSAVNAANAAEPASNTANTADQGNPANTANTDPAPARFVFQPKVCSSYQEGVFGKTMCEAWYKLVDAVMAGEDTFACPDDDTYNWVMGQFPGHSFPVLSDLIDYGEILLIKGSEQLGSAREQLEFYQRLLDSIGSIVAQGKDWVLGHLTKDDWPEEAP